MREMGLTGADADAVGRAVDTLLSPFRHEDVDSWRRAVCTETRDLLRADKTAFQLPWPGLDLLHTDDPGASHLREYTEEHVPALNRRKRYFERILELGVGNLQLFWGHDLPWLFGSAYYNECLVPMRAHDPIWAAAPMPGTATPAILLAHHDRPGGRRFGDRELRILRILRPALAAAVTTLHRIEANRQTLVRSLDAVTVGVLVYDADGALAHRNPAADRILSADGQADRVTNAAASLAASSGAPSTDVRTPTGGYRLSASRDLDPTGRPMTLVIVERTGVDRPGVRELRKRHGLTHRQAQVALLLADRKTNTEVAAALGTSPTTARHYTEAAMAVLGVRSRRDVARALGLHAG